MNHILIKPLGVLVESYMVGPTIKFEMSEQTSFELLSEGADTSASLMVREIKTVTASALVLLRNDFNALADGAEAYNTATETALEARIEAEIAQNRAPVEAPKRRGRKPKVAVEATAEDDGETEDEMFDRRFAEELRSEFTAHRFGIEQVVVRSPEEIPFRQSAAYLAIAANPDFKDKIDERIGQLRKRVNRRAELLTQLQTSGEVPGSALDSVARATYAGDDLEDDSIRLIDQQALGTQRQSVRDQLTAVEDEIRASHQWFVRNVIERYEKAAPVRALPFKDLTVGENEELRTADVIDSFYAEVLVYRS